MLSENQVIVAILSAFMGALLMFIFQRVQAKRGIFSYFVWHSRVAVSADDTVFGVVSVLWNGNPVANLYVSTVELRNESLNDYENVTVRVFTSDTKLLTERTEIVGTTETLNYTSEYTERIRSQSSTEQAEEMNDLLTKKRDYLVPTMNRGQVLRLIFLNAALSDIQPSLWLDILHKGVKLKFRVAQNLILGVPQRLAALVGAGIGILFIVLILQFVSTAWIAATLAFLYGLFVLLPGSLVVRLWRWLRDTVWG